MYIGTAIRKKVGKTGPNRLAKEKSPYLLQHAGNPVDWYPWGEEAFTKAKAENKPIFLSIGYSTCHWCHVMERESFEDSEVAQLINRVFVPIKVDREERPDIDSYYMTVCQLLTGSGGWPLTLILSPDKRPFYAATYLPRQSRFGRIGLLELIPQIENMWRSHTDRTVRSSHDISELVRRTVQANGKGEITEQVLHAAYKNLAHQYDEENGGFGKAPKFPMPHNLSFLMRYYQRTKNKQALKIVDHTLTSMRMGGIYDQIGFGFHRYSTDANWRVPHFEKMLYDQALLLIAYIEGFVLTGNPLHRRTAEEMIEYLMRDMMSEQGGFYAAEDADSEGREGRFYMWEKNELLKILDRSEMAVIVKLFNIKHDGNYLEESTREPSGNNILYMTKPLPEIAAEMRVSKEASARRLARAREKIFAYREERIHPHKDRKILCDWNGLAIAALSITGRILDNATYTNTAQKAADFILRSMRDSTGTLYHRFIDGDIAIPGFLDDYTFLVWGLIELYEATFRAKYLHTALELTEKTFEIFGDEGSAFFFTTEGDDLPLRKKESYDGAVPSGNSVAMLNMQRLAHLTGRRDLDEKANQISDYFARDIQQNPLAHVHLVMGINKAFSPPPQIVIAGEREDAATAEMLRTINGAAMLDVDVLLKSTDESSDIVNLAAFTKNLAPMEKKATAYLCHDYSCEKPTSDPMELAALIEDLKNPARVNRDIN